MPEHLHPAGPGPVRLEEPSALPDSIRRALKSHTELLRRTEFLDSILYGTGIGAIVKELDAILRRKRIHGYHCTREPAPGFFAAYGLRPTNLDQQHQDFLGRFGHHFTSDEVDYMMKTWADYFRPDQRSNREGMVWACLSRSLVRSAGTESFFDAYGGEAVHAPLSRTSSAYRRLASLGEAVVVEIAVPGQCVQSYCQMALSMLSVYHRGINPDAHCVESEAVIRRPVPPADILRVVPFAEFVS